MVREPAQAGSIHGRADVDFARYLGCMFFASLARNGFFVTVAWFSMSSPRMHGLQSVALVLIVGNVAEVAFSRPAGAIADRFRRSAVCSASDLLRALATVMFFLLVRFDWDDRLVYAVIGLFSAADRCFNVAIQSIIVDLVPRDRIYKANSQSSLTMQLGNMVSGVLFGSLIGFSGVARAILVIAACFVLSSSFLARPIGARRGAAHDGRAAAGAPRRDGGGPDRSRFASLCLVYTVCFSLGSVVNVLLPKYVLVDLREDAVAFGFLDSAWAVGAIAAAALLSVWARARILFRGPRAATALVCMLGASTAAFSASHTFLASNALIAAMGFAFSMVRIVINSEVQHLLPGSRIGWGTAWMQGLCALFSLAIYSFVYLASNAVDAALLFLGYAGVILASALLRPAVGAPS